MSRAFAWPRFPGTLWLGAIGAAAVLAVSSAGCGGGTSGTGTGGSAGTGAPGTAGGGGTAMGAAGTSGGGSAGTGATGGAPSGSGGTTAGVGGGGGNGGSSAGAAGSGAAGNGAAGAAAGRGGTTGAGGAAGMAGRGGTTGSAGSGAGGTTGSGGTTGAGGSGGTTAAGDFYVGPNGSDSNPGTQASPFKTITAAHARVSAGGTIWLLSGTNMLTATNNISKSGTASAHIRVQAVAGGTRPVLDFSGQAVASSNRGLDVTGDYWEFRGFEIRNAGDNCIGISGSNNTFDQLVIHGCADTGLQITASSSDATNDAKAANNLVLNCDSYENLDQATNGENADGFAAKLRIGPGNVFRGCRSWNNADDGWDFFASDDVVTVDNCWAFLNGKVVTGTNTAGDGNGFKLGGAPSGAGEGGAVHIVKNSYAFDNRACGFVRNNNPDVPMLTSCGASGNGTAFCSLTSSPVVTITMTGAQGKAAVRNADGSLPAIQ
jgi:hypothetical protein